MRIINTKKSLSPENRKKSRKIVKNPYINSKHLLKELFAKRGIAVNPDAMTYVHVWGY